MNIIDTYKNILNTSKSNDEKYIICLKLFEEIKKTNESEGIIYLIESYKYNNKRIECIYRLVVYFVLKDIPKVSYSFYLLIKDYYEDNFIEDYENIIKLNEINISEYVFYFPYFMIIIGLKLKKFDVSIKMFEIIFKFKYIKSSEWWINNLIFNLQFCLNHVKDNKFFRNCEEYINLLYPIYKLNTELIYSFTKMGLDINNLKIKFNPIKLEIENECKTSNKILIYTGFCEINWNYTYSINNALGGSERAIINIAKNLPKEYEIYISGCVIEETVDNIKFINEKTLKESIEKTYYKTIIISRFINFFELYPIFNTKNLFICGHDTELLTGTLNFNKVNIILERWNDVVTNYICLTEWQKNQYITNYPLLKNKIKLINNGINLDIFPKNIHKIKNLFVFTSGPSRGFGRILELWPEIIKHLPDAQLKFATYANFPSTENDNKMLEIINKYSNIQFMGKLNPKELYELIGTAEYWLYPTNFDETSCITALEMLYSEVICIYYPRAGLVDTIGEYGVKVSSGNEVSSIINLTESEKIKLRENGKKYAESCSWKNRAIVWDELIKENRNINMKQEIFCWWTGNNQITDNRKRCLVKLEEVSGFKTNLITIANLKDYILPTAPFHPAYEYLSYTQRGDYLKVYFMHFYGGCYSDIKETTGSWIDSFNLLNNSDKWIIGYPDFEHGIAYKPHIKYWRDLIGNCAYICKPQTDLTREWYEEVHKLLDSKLEKLKQFPATHPQDHAEVSNGKYPIEWNELNGRIFHNISYKYKDKVLNTLPVCIFKDYR